MNTIKELWRKLSSSKDYRKEYVSTLLKRGTAMQIQALMKQRGLTQTKLAALAGLKQGVISRASNPEYGNLTFNTVIDIAGGFDVAFIGRFVPFSEFAKYVKSMPEELSFSMHSFEDDKEPFGELHGDLDANNMIVMKTPKPKSAENQFKPVELAKKSPQSERGTLDDRNRPQSEEGELADAARVGSFG